MKKWMWIVGVAALALLLRVEHAGTNIDWLEPAELVRVTVEDDVVAIETDTGAQGYGQDLDTAIGNLQLSSASEVFLDTAEYLVVDETAVELLPELWEILRPSCKVCIAGGQIDLAEAAEYLCGHTPTTNLLQCRAGTGKLEILYVQEGRGQLAQ